MTMAEIEAIGNKIAENAILRSERLIDHFFMRAFQFALIVMLLGGVVGLVIFRLRAKSR